VEIKIRSAVGLDHRHKLLWLGAGDLHQWKIGDALQKDLSRRASETIKRAILSNVLAQTLPTLQ
jgi:hypothetical protein